MKALPSLAGPRGCPRRVVLVPDQLWLVIFRAPFGPITASLFVERGGAS